MKALSRAYGTSLSGRNPFAASARGVRPFATNPGSRTPLTTASFIHEALYQRSLGYFNSRDVVESTLGAPLPFHTFLGKADYQKALQRLYAEGQHSWLTPAEVFAPVYSEAIARYIVAEHLKGGRGGRTAAQSASPPLRIFEVGGGSGANAVHCLNWLKKNHSGLYERCQYRILEISERLRERQLKALRQAGHEKAAQSLLCDATALDDAGVAVRDLATEDISSQEPCFLVALEVYDNLPHDKLALFRSTTSSNGNENEGGSRQWKEAVVEKKPLSSGFSSDAPSFEFIESFRPVSDPLSIELLPMVERHYRRWEATREAQTVKATMKRLLSKVGISSSAPAGSGGNKAPGCTSSTGSCAPLCTCLWKQSAGVSPSKDDAGILFDESCELSNFKSGRQGDLLYARFVPTRFLRMMKGLMKTLPNHRLVLADFSLLPPPQSLVTTTSHRVLSHTPAACSPLVASKGEGKTVDHETYLHPSPFGSADIFFPCDFSMAAEIVTLARSYQLKKVSSTSAPAPLQVQAPIRVLDSPSFLRQYAEHGRCATRNGFNPLLEDYLNTRFLLT